MIEEVTTFPLRFFRPYSLFVDGGESGCCWFHFFSFISCYPCSHDLSDTANVVFGLFSPVVEMVDDVSHWPFLLLERQFPE